MVCVEDPSLQSPSPTPSAISFTSPLSVSPSVLPGAFKALFLVLPSPHGFLAITYS